MPKRVPRRILAYVDAHHAQILTLAVVALIIALVFAISGFTKARNAEQTLSSERLGKAIGDVTTCFNSSINGPQLLIILRGIAVEVEPDPRQALNTYINDFEDRIPSTADCVELAEEKGIDPSPYIRNPPSEAG